MEQTQETRQARLIQADIELAEQALYNDNLEEAQKYFEEALAVGGEHPERDSQIRQILNEHSTELASRGSPDWEQAHQALVMLNALNLQGEQTRTWQRELKLQEAQYWFDHNELDQSFAIFSNLISETQGSDSQNELRQSISQLVRDHVKQRFPEQQPSSVTPTDEIHNWLEIISRILNTVSDQEQTQKRYRNLNYALGALIAILIIVVYVTYFAL